MAHPVTFRRYRATDYAAVASLWTRINRSLAPIGMEELFEQYIAMTIDGELKQLLEVFSEANRNAFWVVQSANEIVGSFGIESRSVNGTELRRMYLDEGYRGLGIAATHARLRAVRSACARIHKDDSKHSSDSGISCQVLSKEWISAHSNGNSRENEPQADRRRLDPFSF
jgi:hypothetical protein